MKIWCKLWKETYEEEALKFNKARMGLVTNLRPDIDDKPWWAHKPIINILKLSSQPLIRIRKSRSNNIKLGSANAER